jgi:hypothetical protein
LEALLRSSISIWVSFRCEDNKSKSVTSLEL